MYKLLIADDEEIIRNSIANFMNWNDIGYEVVGCLADGQDVIEYIAKHDVDVVMTDISMTFVSGLGVAKYIYDNKMDIKVVLLSAYKEFEFAKQAIKYNVTNYILKPSDIEEMIAAFSEIKCQLDMKKAEQEENERKQDEIREGLALIREQLFVDMIIGATSSREELDRRIKLAALNINPADSCCCIIKINVVNVDWYMDNVWQYDKEGLYTAIRNFFNYIEGSSVNYYYGGCLNEKIIIMAIDGAKHAAEEFVRSVNCCLESEKARIGELLNLDIHFNMIAVFNNVYEILEKKILNVLFLDSTVDRSGESDEQYEINKYAEYQKLIIFYLNVGNFELVRETFNRFINDMNGVNSKNVKNFLVDLFVTLENKLKKIDIDISVVIHRRLDYGAISDLKDLQEIMNWGFGLLDEIIACIGEYKKVSERKVIQNAKEYINAHFAEGVSQEEVANHVFLSTVYFSRLFKQETGENFIDYLIKVRMEKAMEFLQTDKYKVYEVCYAVGYKKSKYFAMLFKKYTGFTPTQYRSNYLKERGLEDE